MDYSVCFIYDHVASRGVKMKVLNMFDGIFSEKEISHEWKKKLGLIFAILAIIFGCLWYVQSGWGSFFRIMNWPWGSTWVERTFSTELKFKFPPGFLNSLWGLAMCFPIYLRGFVPFNTLSPYSYISFVLNFFLCSVIAQLMFDASGNFTHNTMNTVFVVSLVISWIGMRSIAGFGWLIVFLLALINLIKADYQLKQFGSFFLLFAFSSLLFQTQFLPEDLFRKILSDFKGLKDEELVFVKESMHEAIKATGDGVKAGTKLLP
jgi:hypothetical protein